MIRSILYVHAKPGKITAVVEYYRRKRVLETSLEQPGCLAADIQVPVDADGPLLVTALWESSDAYQGWLGNPIRRLFSAELSELTEDDLGTTSGALYEVAHSVSGMRVRRDRAGCDEVADDSSERSWCQ